MKKTLLLVLIAGFLSSLSAYGQQYTWTQKSDFAGGNRFVPFYFSIGNKGYAGSGITFNGSSYSYIWTDFWEYDQPTNVWTQKADIIGPCRSAAAGFDVGGKGYVTTGWTPAATRSTIEYDPATNSWTQKNDFGGSARYSTSYFAIGNYAYVGMGYSPLTNDFWKYDPNNDLWTQIASIGGNPRQAATGFAINGLGYVFGGTTALSSETNELWSYDPAANSWTQKAFMPGGLRYGSSSFVMNGLGFVGLGANGPTLFNDFYAYDPLTDSWTSIPSLPSDERYGSFAFSINNKGYVGAGTAGIVPTSNLKMDFWELSVTTGINELTSDNLGVYFNSGQLVINTDKNLISDLHFEVVDINGKLVIRDVMRKGTSEFRTDFPFTNAAYICNLFEGNAKVQSVKFVKNQ